MPQAKTGDEALDRIINVEWPYFAENCDTPKRLDFYGMQSLTMRAAARSGRMTRHSEKGLSGGVLLD